MKPQPTLPNDERLADQFSAVLWLWLSDKEIREVNKRNAEEVSVLGVPLKGVCHSHDFCDANMAMLEAWEELTTVPFDMNDDVHNKLWGAAWDLAIKNQFERMGGI